MMLPVKQIILPADLASVKPGMLDIGLLKNIEPYGQLHRLAADAYHALRAKAFADGIEPFKPTSAGDTYRTIEMQRKGFLARYQVEPIAGASTRTWEGKKWYLKANNAPMAAPGTSNHNLGLAVDIHTASGNRLDWMLQNCLAFGFSWEVQSEPWHIRYVAGDRVPAPVQAWLDSKQQGTKP